MRAFIGYNGKAQCSGTVEVICKLFFLGSVPIPESQLGFRVNILTFDRECTAIATGSHRMNTLYVFFLLPWNC